MLFTFSFFYSFLTFYPDVSFSSSLFQPGSHGCKDTLFLFFSFAPAFLASLLVLIFPPKFCSVQVLVY